MIYVTQQSCLEKIKSDSNVFKPNYEKASAMVGEEFAYQLVLSCDDPLGVSARVEVRSSVPYELYEVKHVPVVYPHYEEDKNQEYLVDAPSVLPDALVPLDKKPILNLNTHNTVLWINLNPFSPGDHRIDLYLNDEFYSRFVLNVFPYKLPDKTFVHCQYIDPSSIAKAYHTPLFTDMHWDMLGKYFKLASKNGVTHVLTPIYPPVYNGYLVGDEELQLVGITKNGHSYTFNYDLLDSWICIAKKNGIKNFTFPPMIPSVKTLKCPRLKVRDGYTETILFDDDTDVLSSCFFSFMRTYLRSLIDHLKALGVEDNIAFQFTHAPTASDEKTYLKCREILKKIVIAYPIIDTKVSVDFIEADINCAGMISTAEIEKFLPFINVNRHLFLDIHSSRSILNSLIAAPSMRIRSFGALSYQYRLVSLFGLWFCNYFPPDHKSSGYFDLTRQNTLPSGLGFLAYPNVSGPIPSIRLKQLHFALQDLSVFQHIESLTSRKRVVSLIEKKYKSSLNAPLIDGDKFLKLREDLFALLNK